MEQEIQLVELDQDQKREIIAKFMDEHPGVDLMDLALIQLQDELYDHAMHHMGEMHEFLTNSKEGLSVEEQGRISARVRRQKSGTLIIQWLRQHPVRKSARRVVRGKEISVISKAVTNKGTSVPRAEVITRQSPDYEKAMFDIWEEKFTVLREASAWLGKVMRDIAYMRRANDKVRDMD